MPLAGFTEHFLATFPDLVGGKVLVALSGGADSVALLHLLREDALDLDVEAVHVNHGIRGKEAERDASYCRDLCSGLGVAFHLLEIDPDTPLEAGREGTWRRLRYRAMLDLKDDQRFHALATGHHRDDGLGLIADAAEKLLKDLNRRLGYAPQQAAE